MACCGVDARQAPVGECWGGVPPGAEVRRTSITWMSYMIFQSSFLEFVSICVRLCVYVAFIVLCMEMSAFGMSLGARAGGMGTRTPGAPPPFNRSILPLSQRQCLGFEGSVRAID